MRPLRNLTFSGLALVVLIALSGQAFSSSTVAVGTCTKLVNYPTIQQAVTAVSANGTVKVCPGTYPEQVTITKNLTLIGIGPTASTVVVPAGGLLTNGVTDIYGNQVAAQIFVQGANAVTISHIAVDGANDQVFTCAIDPIGIYFQNSAGTITDDAVRNVLMPPGYQGCQGGLAINVESDVGSPVVNITNNSVRNYDKNGITVSGPGTGGPNATVSGNTVVGLGPTPVIAQNGIQIGYGAGATVQNNYVVDDIYTGGYYGSSGILIYLSDGTGVAGNTVESTQYGIVPVANRTLITGNHVGGTQTYDAIDDCGEGGQVTSNVIYGSSQDAIHLDDTCGAGSGSNIVVEKNTINEACAGILQGPLATGDKIPLSGASANTFLNVNYTVLGDSDSCTPTLAPDANAKTSATSAKRLRPSPYKPNRD
ncbi:MAG: right-handed parallel beta-helix repeat-containing protein [Terriglobales bacterium]